MSDKGIKVTDKRMFTPDGQLREEYRDLDQAGTDDATADPSTSTAAPEPAASPPPGGRATTGSESQEEGRAMAAATGTETEPSARVEIPPTGQDLGRPTFFDLVGVLAQPVAIYLGDARLPDGESAENLELARLHIDLLEVLRNKTAGSLTAQELTFLDDLLYQLRLRYVQKRG